MKQLVPMDSYGVDGNSKRVYVVETEFGCKIGVSKCPKARIKQLLIGSPSKYTNFWESPPCSNAFEIERASHEKLSKRKIKNEWFDIEFLEAVCLVQLFQFKEEQIERRSDLDFSSKWFLKTFYPSLLLKINEIGFDVFDSDDGPYLEGEFEIMSLDLFSSMLTDAREA